MDGEPIIDVRAEPGLQAGGSTTGRPLLAFQDRAPDGPLWVLTYLDNPCSVDAGIEEQVFPGGLDEIERVYDEAQEFLRRRRRAGRSGC